MLQVAADRLHVRLGARAAAQHHRQQGHPRHGVVDVADGSGADEDRFHLSVRIDREMKVPRQMEVFEAGRCCSFGHGKLLFSVKLSFDLFFTPAHSRWTTMRAVAWILGEISALEQVNDL
jgi:hypothetical protein